MESEDGEWIDGESSESTTTHKSLLPRYVFPGGGLFAFSVGKQTPQTRSFNPFFSLTT